MMESKLSKEFLEAEIKKADITIEQLKTGILVNELILDAFKLELSNL